MDVGDIVLEKRIFDLSGVAVVSIYVSCMPRESISGIFHRYIFVDHILDESPLYSLPFNLADSRESYEKAAAATVKKMK